ncbi:hypothetical protein BJV82DRAFT_336437 [Fennellomyces sp. T-0311]|nr:hypothetical protein BJV82DRAFT_336437 [Fennellomyces sp. T-0311]
MARHLFLTLLVLIIAPIGYSWRVDYSCVGCTESYYRSGTDQAQFIFSEVDYGIIGFDIWLSQGANNASTYRVAVLGEDISTTTYRTDLPANITTNDNYFFNIQANTSTDGLVLGPFGIQAAQPSTSSSATMSRTTTSAPGGPTQSPDEDQGDGSGASTSTIVGAVVGAVGGVALIFAAIFFVRRKNKSQQDNSATQNLMNDNYGAPPPQGYPAPQGYVPPPVVTYAPSSPHPDPPAQYFSIKPDASPAGAQYAAKQSPKPQQHQSPNAPHSPPAPPYQYQNPHVPDEVSYQSPHTH